MSRIAILTVVGDKKRIDKYVFTLVRELKKIVSKMVVTVNGELSQEDSDSLKLITKEVFYRPNIGYDCGAFKDTLEKYVGWDEVDKYDELLLVNDSCFGPLFPLTDLFDSMEKRELDFWGITEQTPIRKSRNSLSLLPYHVQTYFINITSRMLHSTDFREYWQKVIPASDYKNAVANFELTFSKFFNERGYKSGAYVDCKEFCPSEDENMAYIFFNSFRLLSEYNCPFLKKKVFSFSQDLVLSANSGETARKALEYVTHSTEYDEGLIWDCLNRNNDLDQLKTNLHLDFFVDETVPPNNTSEILFAIFLKDEKIDSNVINFINTLDHSDNLILIGFEKVLLKYEKVLEGKCNYVSIDFSIMDKDIIEIIGKSYVTFILNEKSFTQTNVRRLVCQDVVNIFADNPFLGFCTLPSRYDDTFFLPHFSESSNYNHIIIRSELFKKVSGNSKFAEAQMRWAHNVVEEHDSISQIYKIVAKENGFCFGEISTYKQASQMITDYHFFLKEYVERYIIPFFKSEVKDIRKINHEVVRLCKEKNRIFIYGAGDIARDCFRFLAHNAIWPDAFIVSDGLRENDEIHSIKVYELAEMNFAEEDIVIVATAPVYFKEISEALVKKGPVSFITYEVD